MEEPITVKERKGWKYFQTFCLSYAFFVLGVCVALVGPALPTIAYNLHSTEDNISFVFTARGTGYLIGSIVCAYFFKIVNHHLVLACGMLFTALGNYAIPFTGSYALLIVELIVAGLSMGLLDTGGNVSCLKLWGVDSESWIQLLHFSFAFGATLSPVIAKPFIREVDRGNNPGSLSQPINVTEMPGTTEPFEMDSFPLVAWAFIIAASSCVVASLLLCYLACSKDTIIEDAQEDTTALEGFSYRMKIMALMFLFNFLYVGTEVAFGLFIYYFAIHCEKGYSKDTGTYLNSLFWGAFAVGRFFAIFFAKCMTPKTMLILDLIGTTISTIAMVMFPKFSDDMEWVLWAAVALYGWSMASLFPSGLTWAEQYITVTGNAATIFVVGASSGEMVLPFLMSKLIVIDPMNLMYFCLISTCACMIIFGILVIITSKRGSRHAMRRSGSKLAVGEPVQYDAVATEDTELEMF